MVSINLSWTDNSDNENEFRVYRTTKVAPTFPDDYTQIDTVGADTTSYTDTNAPNGESVDYAVTAANDDGESDPTKAIIETIGTPTVGTPFADSNSEIVVSWSKNDNSSAGSHAVDRADNGGPFQQVASGLSASTAEYATGTHVPDSDTYQYRVRRLAGDDELADKSGDVYVEYVVTITGTNSPVSAGDSLDVDVEVANNGTIEGDQEIALTVTEQ